MFKIELATSGSSITKKWNTNERVQTMKGDDQLPRNGKLAIRDSFLVIAGLSLALWAIGWTVVVLVVEPVTALLKGFGFW